MGLLIHAFALAAATLVFARRGRFTLDPDAATRLREAGAARIYFVGCEVEEAETALLEVVVAEVIYAGSDTLAILEDTLAVTLGELQSQRVQV
jgi:hypothetical protein